MPLEKVQLASPRARVTPPEPREEGKEEALLAIIAMRWTSIILLCVRRKLLILGVTLLLVWRKTKPRARLVIFVKLQGIALSTTLWAPKTRAEITKEELMAEPVVVEALKAEEPKEAVVAKGEIRGRIREPQPPSKGNPLRVTANGDPNAVMRRTQAIALRTTRKTSGKR
jgi:hypothetical protein